MLAEGGQKISFDELEAWKRETWSTEEEEVKDFLSWYAGVKAAVVVAAAGEGAKKGAGYGCEAASV